MIEGVKRKEFFNTIQVEEKMKKVVSLICACALTAFAAEIQVSEVVGDQTWTNNNVYVLNGFVFVEDGESVTIEPGTVIKGLPGQRENSSSLIVCRGGQIFANGTAEAPIIFTSYGQVDPTNPDAVCAFGPGARGLWGGVIILGRAPICTPGGEEYIEGIPGDDPRGYYGGDVADDNSGVFKYVSIRHGGTEIGSGNEINGLTMGGVGNGTEIHHVEVMGNLDDGFEWFGGTVNCSHLVAAFVGDDDFDFDQCYVGNGQFFFGIKHVDGFADHSSECDGTEDVQGHPGEYSDPEIWNATYLGTGMNTWDPVTEKGQTQDHSQALRMRDGFKGDIRNSLIGETDGRFAQIEHSDAVDSWDHLMNDDLLIRNNMLWNFSAGNTWSDLQADATTIPKLGPYNILQNPYLRGIAVPSFKNRPWLDPRPVIQSPALNPQYIATVPDNDFHVQTDYLGAFGPNDLWIEGWTALDNYRISTRLFEITPNNVEVAKTQKFEILGQVKVPGVNFTANDVQFLINGADMSAAARPAMSIQDMAAGGKTIRVKGVSGGILVGGGAYPQGRQVTITMIVTAGAETYEATATLKVNENG